MNLLRLQPHPEGGAYGEVYRSPLVTVIYFLLRVGEVGRWHRVRGSDEVWQFLEGSPLHLFAMDPRMKSCYCAVLEPVKQSSGPVSIIASNWWQAARPTGEYSLATCTVGPPFDFGRFDLMRDVPEAKAVMLSDFGTYAPLL